MQSKGFSKLFSPEPLKESDKGGLIGVYNHNVKDEQPHTHQSFFWRTGSTGIAFLLPPAEGQTVHLFC